MQSDIGQKIPKQFFKLYVKVTQETFYLKTRHWTYVRVFSPVQNF